MRRAALALAAVAALAGCGGTTKTPPRVASPPHIPRALAHSWASQASTVAQEIAAGNTCTAHDDASALAATVARSAYQVPVRLRARLTAVVAALPGRIRCVPAPPVTPPTPTQPAHPHPPHPPHGHGPHHDHGHGNGQGDDG